MLEIKNLTKTFGTQTVISDISMTLVSGKIYGLVGRNGSGKTMLMKMILGFVSPSSGSIKIEGKVLGKDISMPDRIGAIIENPGFLPEYSGFKNLKFLAMIHHKISNEEIRNAMRMVGLDPDSKKHVGKYSLGMRQRLGIAQAIMEDPDILLLDEPLNGLDNEGVEEIRKVTDGQCKIGGMTATTLDTKEVSNSEVIVYIVIAVILCLVILEIALDSYLIPVLLLGNIGIAILYNMGSNILLGQISYITKAISAVLQLGVTMDFAIFLYHSYKTEKEETNNNDEAMSKAITSTLVSVLGSATTTIAGFLALCSMNLTLGRDIGLVMAKGVLIGLICAVTILPAAILMFDKAIEKTRHKEILPKFTKVRDFSIKHYKAIIVAFLIILPFAVYGYTHTENYYNLDKSLPDTLQGVQANNELKEKFGIVSTELVLVDKDMPDYKVNQMLDEINNLDGIDMTLSYASISKGQIPKEILPDEIKSIFQSDKYQMIIISSKYELATNELNDQVEKVKEIVKR